MFWDAARTESMRIDVFILVKVTCNVVACFMSYDDVKLQHLIKFYERSPRWKNHIQPNFFHFLLHANCLKACPPITPW